MKITYRQEGDFLVPNIDTPPQPMDEIGPWGQQREKFLFEERHWIYSQLSVKGTLKQHLLDIDREAERRFKQLVEQTAKAEGVNEDLKKADQLDWVGKMNNIRSRAREIVMEEIITAPMQ